MVNDPRDAPGDWGGLLGVKLVKLKLLALPKCGILKKRQSHQSGTTSLVDWNACCTIASNLVKLTQHLDKISYWIRVM